MGVFRRLFSRQRNNLSNFFRLLVSDYREVGSDVVSTFKTRPLRSSIYAGLLLAAVHGHHSRPSAESYRSALTEAALDVGRLSPSERNEAARREVLELLLGDQTGRLRHLDLILFSVVWRSDFPARDNTYEARCKHLRPPASQWLSRVEDVGCWNRWHRLERLMEDYDVNPETVANLEEGQRSWWQAIKTAWRTTLRRQYT